MNKLNCGGDRRRFAGCIAAIAAAALIVGVLAGCGGANSNGDEAPAYVAAIQEWHAKRIERLREPTSWLSLVGLFWLEQGENTFGSAKTNALVFPKDKAPARLGTLTLAGDSVTVAIAPDAEVTQDGRRVTSMPMYHDQDPNHEVTVLESGSLSWYVIKRGDRIGIRLKNSDSEALKTFDGIDTYPIDSRWRIAAKLVPHDPPRTLTIVNVLGDESREPSPGTLTFEIGGKTHTLVPIAELDDDKMFLVFGDNTNGKETYGGGRFLVVDAPDEEGGVVIDFNKAYNPPCVFSPYATCPLPPDENRLAIAVTAGEKTFGSHSH